MFVCDNGGTGVLCTGTHCTKNSKHIFLEMKLRGLVPNFYIHVSVSDFIYIPTICPRQTNRGNILIAHRYIYVEIRRQKIIILFWKQRDHTVLFLGIRT